MTKFQTSAYVMSQSIAANIEAMGMVAENTYRINRDETVAYIEEDFIKLIDKYGLGCNTVMILFQHCEDN